MTEIIPIAMDRSYLEGKGLVAEDRAKYDGYVDSETESQSSSHLFHQGKIRVSVIEAGPAKVRIEGLPFDEFVHWSFVESFAYSRDRSLAENLPYIGFRLSAIFEGSWLIALAGSIGIIALAAKRSAAGCFALGLLVFSLVAVVPGFAYRHYFAQLAPAVAVERS